MDVTPIRRKVAAAALRMRLVAGLDRAVTTALLSVVTLLVGLFYLKAGALAPSDFWVFLLVAAGWALAGFCWGALGRVTELEAALALDRALGSRDALASALAFARALARAPEAQRPFMEAEIRRALDLVDQASPRKAVPLRWPRDTAALGVLLGTLLAFAFVSFPRPNGRVAAAPPSEPTEPPLQVEPSVLREYREEVDQLREQAKKLGDKDLERVLEQTKRLLEDLEQGRITRSEFERRYQELLRAYGQRDERLEELQRAVDEVFERAGQRLGRSKQAERLARALKERDLQAAERELERLARRLEHKELSARQRRELQRAFKEAAKMVRRSVQARKLDEKLKRHLRDLQRRMDQNRRHLRELQRRMNRAGSPQERQELQNQVQRARSRQQSLQRSARRAQAARRMLRELQRSLKRAGRGRMDAKTASELRKLMSELRKYRNQTARSQARSQGKMTLQDLRELLKRLRRQGGNRRKGRIRDFFRRASGGGRMNRPGGGRPGRRGPRGGRGKQGGGRRPGGVTIQPGGIRQGGLRRGGQRQGQWGQAGGSRPGTRPGGNPLGTPTSLDGDLSEHQARSKEGQGPSTEAVVRGAASKGFVTRSYRRLYIRYRRLQRQVLEEEDIPPGYRYYVRRYFKLIRPRK